MIQPKLAVSAEAIIRDAETNTISVFSIIEEISAASFPIGIPKLSTLFLLERDQGDPEHIDAIILLSLNDKEIGQATIHSNFEGKLRTRLILVAQGVVIEEPGIFTITLTIN